MKEFVKKEFEELDPSVLAVLVFSAEWCGPCQALHPIMENLAESYKDKKAVFFHVNVDSEKEFAESYSIRNIPCVIFVQDKAAVHKIVGLSPRAKYATIIEKFLR
jgi:thioredoxin 1